ncbi:hypothetical protein TrispH2_012148, partial [Trichoplax sp. H2]
NKITEALNLLCGKNIKPTESSKSFNQQGNNGSNCGPITFANIHDYMKIEIPNSDLQSDEKYSIREFSKTGSSSIKNRRKNDIKIYTEMIKKYGKLETKNDMQPSIEKSNSSTSEYEKKEKTQSDRSAKIPNPEKAKKIFETLNAQNSITSPKMLQDLKDLLTYEMTLSKSAATITKPIRRQSFKEAASDSNEIDERLNIISSSKPSQGLKSAFHGTIYQIALIALIAVRANAKRDQFALASEAEGYDKFDDLVVYTRTSVIYIQVKHRLDHTYKEKDFYSMNQSKVKGCPLLWLYFDYWLRIKNSDDYMKNCKNKTHQFVFFSNCKVEIPSYLYEKATISPGYLFKGLEGRSFRFKELSKDSDFVKCIFTHVEKQANKLEKLLDANTAKAKDNLTKSLNHACCILRNVKNDLQKARNHFYEQNSHHYILISDMAIITSKDPMRSKFREKMNKGQRILFDEHSREIEDKINNIMLRQIYQFFEEFIVKLDQPDTSQLERLTYNEVRSKTELAATEVYSTLRAYMIDWLADNKVCWLQSNEFDKIVKASKNEESRFYLLKHTETFKTEYHELIQDHKESIQAIKIEALEKFLIDTDHKNLVMLLYGVGIQLRIYQTLSNLPDQRKIDEWSFLEIASIWKMQERLLKILEGDTLQFLIIDCRLPNKSSFEMPQTVLKAAIENKKKVILIIESDDKEICYKKISEMDRNIKPDRDSNHFKILYKELGKLSSDKLKVLYENHNKKYINLAGKSYPLFKILEDTTSSLYEFVGDVDNTAIVLNDIKEGKTEHPLAIKLPCKVYLENPIIQMMPIYKLRNILEEKNFSLLIFEGLEKSDTLESLLDGWFNKAENRTQFTAKIVTPLDPDIIYILLTKESDIDRIPFTPEENKIMIYVGEYNSLSEEHRKLKHVVVKRKDPNTDQLENISVVTNSENVILPTPTIFPKINNFVILSANAGYGKTALFINRLNEWAEDENSESIISWKLYIHLPSQKFDNSLDLETSIKPLVRDFINKDWQLKALLNDMKKEGRVEFFLDGLDEIKDENKINSLNKLLALIPTSTTVVIATRPHAVHKVNKPRNRNLGLYLTLGKYTDQLRNEYIKRMFPKILEKANKKSDDNTSQTEDIPKHKITEITNNLCESIDQELSEKVQHLIGIPLECYIYCETKASKIAIHGTDCIDNGYGVHEKRSKINTSNLYQEFLFTKLKDFTLRYLKISFKNESESAHRIYNVSSNYILILAVLAFKQAFQLPPKFVHLALARSYFTNKMVLELGDTGLVTVSDYPDEDPAYGDHFLRLKFHHSTYQEYLAALCLLYGLILDDKLRSEVQSQIMDNRYNPGYTLIMSLASQLSVDEIELIPGYVADKHAILFWKALCDEADILGAAESKLLQNCLCEFSKKMKKTLKKVVKDTRFSTKILKELDKHRKSSRALEEFSITDQSSSPLIFDDSKFKNERLQIQDSDKKKLLKKEIVISSTKDLLKCKGPDYVAKIFEIITEEIIEADREKVKSANYWGMDGGFEAMALLGDSFNYRHAKYFIERIDNYPEHRWNPALKAIESLLKDCTKPSVKAECFKVIEYLAKHALDYDDPGRLIPLIKAVRSEIFESFSQLEDQIRKLPEYSIPNEIHGRPYQQFILKFTFALWISIKMPYAVIKSNDTHEIIIKEEKVKKIKIDQDKVHVWNLIENVINELAEESDEDKKALLLINTKRWKCFIYERLVETAIKNKDNSVLHDETFIDIVVKDYHIVANILKIYHDNELIEAKVAERLLAFINIIERIKSIQWPIQGGIEAIAYTGKYFNQKFADFLLTRACWYKDNRQKALASLEVLDGILQNCNDDDTYRGAVDAYKWCLKQETFKAFY